MELVNAVFLLVFVFLEVLFVNPVEFVNEVFLLVLVFLEVLVDALNDVEFVKLVANSV